MTLLLNPNQNPIPVPHASNNQEGVVFANEITATEDVFIFADEVNGNDANNGTTPGTAVQTFEKALNLMPSAWRKNCIVSLAAGNYTWPAEQFTPGKPLGMNAFPPAIIGGFDNAIGDQATSAPANNYSVVANPPIAMAVDFYRGACISMMTGASAGERRLITSNTAVGEFNINSPWYSGVSAGDIFRIEVPNVNISNAFRAGVFFAGGTRIGWKGINFINAPFAGAGNGYSSFGVYEGCTYDINGTAFRTFHDSESDFESNPVVWNTSNPLNPFDFLRGPAGMYFKNGLVTAGSFFSGVFGYVVADNVFFGGDTYGDYDLYMPNFRNCAVSVSWFSRVGLYGGEGGLQGLLDGSQGAETIFVGIKSEADLFSIDINNSAGDAVHADQDSFIMGGGVHGSGNAGAGARVTNSSKFNYYPGLFTWDVNLAAGDQVVLGTAAAITYAAVAGAGGVSDVRLNLASTYE